MALSDIISSVASLASAQATQPNFGTPAILANNDNTTSWGTAVVRSYSSIGGVGNDFATSTATYLQAEAFFEQSPNPGLLLIGLRTTSALAQIFFLDVTAAGLTYLAGLGAVNFTVNANAFSYTGVSGDSTHDTAISDLVTALTGASWYAASGLSISIDSTNGGTHHLVKVLCTAATISDIVIGQSMLNYLILYQAQGGSADAQASALVASTTGGDGITWTATVSGAQGAAGNLIKINQAASSGSAHTCTVTTSAPFTVININPHTADENSDIVSLVAATPAAAALVTGVATGASDVVIAGTATLSGGTSNTKARVAADVAAIIGQNPSFYTLLAPTSSPLEIEAITSAALANGKTYIYQTSDTNNLTVAPATDATLAAATPTPTNPPVTGTSASIFALEKAAGSTLDGIMGIYTQTLLNFTDAAWAGARLWTTPGSENWAYCTLPGVTTAVLTETQRNNVVGTIGNIAAGKYGNVYENVGGLNITEFGITRGGQFFDTVRFLAWVNATIPVAILTALAAASAAGTKIPYTQDGITYICGLVLGVLKQGVAAGGFAAVPSPAVPIPAISSISNANLTARNLPNIDWSATLAGAINTAQVQGQVTV